MRVLVPDGVLAATMCGIAMVGAPHAAVWQTTSRPMDAWGYVLIVLATVPLAGRRRWPLPVLGVTAVTLAVYAIAGYPYGPVMFALVVAAYTAGARLPVRRSLLACLVLTPLLVAHAFVPPVLGSVFRALPVSGWVIVPSFAALRAPVRGLSALRVPVRGLVDLPLRDAVLVRRLAALPAAALYVFAVPDTPLAAVVVVLLVVAALRVPPVPAALATGAALGVTGLHLTGTTVAATPAVLAAVAAPVLPVLVFLQIALWRLCQRGERLSGPARLRAASERSTSGGGVIYHR